jgi:hypothetical protein
MSDNVTDDLGLFEQQLGKEAITEAQLEQMIAEAWDKCCGPMKQPRKHTTPLQDLEQQVRWQVHWGIAPSCVSTFTLVTTSDHTPATHNTPHMNVHGQGGSRIINPPPCIRASSTNTACRCHIFNQAQLCIRHQSPKQAERPVLRILQGG